MASLIGDGARIAVTGAGIETLAGTGVEVGCIGDDIEPNITFATEEGRQKNIVWESCFNH